MWQQLFFCKWQDISAEFFRIIQTKGKWEDAGTFFVLTNRSFIGIIFEQLRECWNGRQARLRCVWFRRVGSSPISRTNKKVPFVYRTKGTFLSDVCLRQMMLATPMMPLTLMMSLC